MGGGGTISNPFIWFITLLALEVPRLMGRPFANMLRMTMTPVALAIFLGC